MAQDSATASSKTLKPVVVKEKADAPEGTSAPLQQIPPGVVSLADHEAAARARLDANAWAYFSGGAANELTLHANQVAWQSCQLQPRVLRDLRGGHTRSSLLGRTLSHPIFLAPVAFQRLVHPDGEVATACAASAQQAGLVLSTQSSVSLETVAQAVARDVDRGPLWFQLYWTHSRSFNLELVRRAERAGFVALVVTVDAPVNGARDRERRAGFYLPEGIAAVNLAGLPPRTAPTLQAQHSALFDDLLLDAITWDDITWLLANTRLPVLLKGITHPQDAVQAQQLGVAHVLRLLRDELEIAMALCGCATLAQVNADCLLTDAWPNKQADPTADNPNPACGGLQ